MDDLFFDNWQHLGHVAISTVIAFVVLFLFLRISGKRTLSKLNAFDFVVTVALGSTLAYMMLSLVPLLEGVTVLLLIILMQFVFAWMARSSQGMEKMVNSVPSLLFYDGIFMEKEMAKEAITEEEIHAAMRSSGIFHIDDVKAVVMELNGEISVIKKSSGNGKSTLDDFHLRSS